MRLRWNEIGCGGTGVSPACGYGTADESAAGTAAPPWRTDSLEEVVVRASRPHVMNGP